MNYKAQIYLASKISEPITNDMADTFFPLIFFFFFLSLTVINHFHLNVNAHADFDAVAFRLEEHLFFKLDLEAAGDHVDPAVVSWFL